MSHTTHRERRQRVEFKHWHETPDADDQVSKIAELLAQAKQQANGRPDHRDEVKGVRA